MNLNVSLTDELMKYVKDKVDTGRYTSSSEVVREALRLLEEQDKRKAQEIHRLQHAWREGMDSGDFEPLDFDALKAEGRKLLAQPKA